jgi:site-specific recombinase XerD
MFEKIFSYPAVLRRHCEGPLASERLAYLKYLHDRGAALGTLLRQARYCLRVAREIQHWPRDHRFSDAELEAIAASWAARRVAQRRAAAPRWPQEQFRSVACSFLGWLGRLAHCSDQPASPYDALVEDFLQVDCQARGLAPATRKNRSWHIRRFLFYLDQQGHSLERLTPAHLDAYLQHLGQTWSRVSLSSTARALRAWFRHCEIRGKTRAGLADSILVPRIYQHEGLPLGPTWEQVKGLIPDPRADQPAPLRDRAILLLLAIYGWRSGEVRRLQLDDIDWKRDRLGVVRSKSGRREWLPLEPHTGNAIARYLRQARPKCDTRCVFVTLKAPFRPLSGGAVYHLVSRRLLPVVGPEKRRSPHALRHACARRLVDAGLSLKEIGDHLGHRSPDATRIYAKVDLTSLRRVAMEDLGGLL